MKIITFASIFSNQPIIDYNSEKNTIQLRQLQKKSFLHYD